jgi:hypothetical protein
MKKGWHQRPRARADYSARTKDASKSAQGESDTAGSGLRSTTCGTRVHTSIARVCPSKKDSGSSEWSNIGGNAGRVSTSAWTRMYSSGPTPEIMKEEGTPRSGAGWDERGWGDGLGRGRTCDGFPAVDDGQHGECVSRKRTVLGWSKLAVRRTAFGVFVPQVLPQVSQHITQSKGSDQVQGADFEAKPGEWRQRRQRILIQRNKRLETHDGTEQPWAHVKPKRPEWGIAATPSLHHNY